MEEQIREQLKILQDQPADADAMASIEAMYTQRGEWEALARLLEDNAQRLGDSERTVGLLLKAADLYRDKLQRVDKSERALRRALDVVPRHRGALERLRQLLADAGRHADVASIIERQVDAALDDKEKARHLKELGKIYDENLDLPEQALRALQAAFEADRTAKSALLRGASIYRRLGRHEMAKGLLDLLLEVTEEESDAQMLADRYADVAGELEHSPTLHDVARDAVTRALALVPGHARATELEQHLASYAESWQDQVRTLRAQAMEARDKKTAASRYLAIAEHHWVYGKDAKAAEEALEKGFLLVPGHWSSVRFLERMGREAGHIERVLERLTRMASEVTDVRIAVDLYLLVAVLEQEAGGNGERLVDVYGKVLKIDPANRNAAAALTDIHLSAGQHAEAAQVQAHYAGEVRDRSERLAAHLLAARLFVGDAGDPAEAVRHFEAVCEIDADHGEAIAALDALYQGAGRHADRARLLERRVELGGEAAAQAELHDGLAALYADHLDDPLLSYQALRRAYALDPRQEREDALERLADTLARPSELAETYLQAAERLDDAAARQRLWLRAADLAQRAGAPNVAREALGRVLNEDPNSDAALNALESLVVKGEDARALAEALEARLAVARATKERHTLLLRLARLYAQELRDAARAIDRYRALLDLDPADGEALEALDGLLRREERWRELAVVVEKRIALSDEPAASELRLRLAKLLEDRLNKPIDALELYETMHSAAPERLDVVAALERLLLRGVETVRIAGVLQPHYAAVGAHRRHVEMIEIRRQATEDPARRATLAREAGRVLEEELRNPREAFTALSMALVDQPEDSELPRALDRLAESAGCHDELARVLEKAAAALPESPAKVALEARRADILEQRLGNADAAIEAHRNLLRQNPGNLGSLDALIGLLEATGRHEELVEWLEVRRDFTDLAERAALDERIGLVLSEQLQHTDEAIQAFERAREGKDDRIRERALLQLDTLYLARGDGTALRSVLEERAVIAVGTERSELFARIGELCLDARDASAALPALAEALRGDGQNARAIAALARLCDDDTADQPQRVEAARILEPVRRDEDNAAGLVKVLSLRMAASTDTAQRRALVVELATLLTEDLDRSGEAVDLLLQHVQADPEDTEGRGLAERLALASGEHERLFATLHEMVVAGGAHAEPMARRLVELARERGNPGVARAALTTLLEANPEHSWALSQLVDLSRSDDSPATLGEALLAQAQVLETSRAIPVLLEAAEAFVLAQNIERAVLALRMRIDLGGFDLAVADRLAAMLTSLERHEEVAGLWHDAKSLAEASLYPEISLRLAMAHLGPLENPEAAVKHFGECLDANVEGEAARRAVSMLDALARGEHQARHGARTVLAAHFRHSNQPRPLIEMLELTADECTQAEERAAMFDEITALRDGTLQEATLAFAAATRSYRASPSDQRLLQLRDLAARSESDETYVALLEEIADGCEADERSRAADLLKEAARASGEQLGDRASRVRLLQKVLELVPGDGEALAALESSHREAAETEQLVQVLLQKAEATEGEERFDSLIQAARLQVEAPAQRDEGITLLRRLAEENPQRGPVLELLETALSRRGDRLAASQVLRQRIELEEDAGLRGAMLTRLGRMLLGLERHSEALESLAAAAAEAARDPSLAAAIGELLEHARTTGTPSPVAVAELMETVLRAIGSTEDLPPVLEIRLQASNEPALRQELLLEIAHIQETMLGQPALAFMTACRALREVAGDVSALERADRLARHSNWEEELVDVIEEIVEDLDDAAASAQLHARAAELCSGDNARALQHIDAAYTAAPDDLGVAETLVRLGRDAPSSPAIAGALARVADASVRAGDPARAKELWREAAERHEDLEAYDDAVRDLEAILDLDGQDSAALHLLDRLYLKLERSSDLENILVRQLDLAASTPVRGELLLRLAELRRSALGDLVGAAEALERVALEVPGAVGLVSALEALSGDLASATAADAMDARARIASLLAPRYEASGDVAKLVEILESRLDSVTDVDERRGLMLRVAKLRSENMGQPEKGFALLSRALKEWPADDTLMGSVEHLARETGDVELLIGLYEDIADVESDRALALQYRRRIAVLCRGPLNDPQRALGHYEHVLDLLGVPSEDDAEQRQVRVQVVAAMEDIARSLQAWSALATALKRRAQLDTDAAHRRQAALELCRLQLGPLGDTGGALGLARGLLEVNSADIEALDIACDASERQNQFELMVEFLRRRIDHAPAGPARLDLRFRLGKALDEWLDRPDDAMIEFSAVLDEDPHHEVVRTYLEQRLQQQGRPLSVNALESAYAKTGDWKKSIEVLEGQVQEAEKRNDLAAMRSTLLRIGDIYTRQMESPELAFVALTRGLRAEPGEDALRERLLVLSRELDTLDNLAELYESTAESAVGLGRGEVASELLEAAAAIYAFELDDTDRGLALFEEVLAKHPGRIATLAGLDRLYEQLEQHDKLEVTLRKRLALTEEASERVEILYRLGLVLADHLDRLADAVPVLERVLESDPGHAGSRHTLAELYVAVGENDKLQRILESLLEDAHRAEDQGEEIRLRTLLARVLDQVSDIDGAITQWEALGELDPSNFEVLNALEELYPRAGRYEALRVLLERQMELTTDNARQAELSSKLGLLLAEQLGDRETAVARFEKILEQDPRNRSALDALRRIYRSMEHWDDLIGVLRRLLRLQTDATGVKQVRFELAEVLGTHLDRRADAIEAGRRVLDVEPHTEDELTRLEAVFRVCEAWEECAETLDRRVDLATDPAAQIPVLYEVAALWEGPIGRPESGARAYERILAMQPGDDRAYLALTSIYTHANEWRKLVALKEARLTAVEERLERIAMLKEIGEIYEGRLAQKDLAFLAACRAFREDVLDRGCGDWMERLAVDTDSIEELLDVYDDEVQRVGDEQRAIEIHLRMADLAANRLSDVDAAESHLNRVFEYDAGNRDALEQLFALYEKQDRWEEAIAVLERKAELAEDLDTKKALLFKISQVHEERLDHPQEAIEVYKRVLELDGADQRAVNSLARLYEEMGKDQALIGVLQRAIELEPDPQEQLATRFRIATIWENELDNAEQAIATHRTILELDPAHGLSLKALERIYTQLDRMSELLGVYEKQVALAESIEEQVKLLAKIAGIWEDRFDNVEQAVAATERILLIQPSNEAALKSLERLFRQTANWPRLIDVMRQHIALTRDPEEIVALYLEVGEIYYRDLNRADKAEEMFNAAMDFDPKSRRAIHALGQLYERSGNWFNALEKLAQEVDLRGADESAVEIHYRMGKINEDMLLDTQSARASYERALDLEPTFLPAIKALKEIHYAARDYETYLKYLNLEAEHIDDEQEKTELHTQAAKFLQDRSGDLDRAYEHYELALSHTPDHLPAAIPAADIAFRKENFERTRELLEIVVEKLDPGTETEELVRHQYRLGYVSQKLGHDGEALKAYQRAFELDSTYLPALEGYGQALVSAQRFEEAQKVYQTLLIHHRDSLTDAEVVDYYWQLGDLSRKLEQNERALRNLEKALELDPSHAPSLRLQAEVFEVEDQLEEAYDSLSQLAAVLGGDDKVEILLHIGRLSQKKLTDPYRAIDAYEDAHRLRGDDKSVLEALYELYQETRQGPRAAEVLEELVAVEPDEQTRVRLNHQLGEIFRDEIKNDHRAAQYFNAALDLDPTYVRSFEAIEKLLTARKQWALLEENYRMMIQRTPKENIKVRTVLWKNLAELYRRVLKNGEAAIQAYNVLCAMDPNNPEYLETLAELMSRSPEKIDGAIGTYQQLVPLSAEPARACHALRRLYLSRQMHDRAYCAVSALRILRDVDEEEEKLYAYFQKYAPQKAQRALTDRLWEALLVHENAQGHLATVSTLLYKHAGRELLEDPKELGLGKKREWDRVASSAYFATQLHYVHQVLNTPQYEIYAKHKSDSVLTVLPTPSPTLGIGETNDLFKDVPPRHIWFVCARILTYSRPGFLLPFVLGPADFAAAVEAAFLFAEPRFQGRSDPEDVARLGRRMARVKEPLGDAMRAVLKKILGERKRPDVNVYFEGMELTAIRAAHLMCGDVDVSTQMLRARDPGHMQLQYKAKMKEILQFTVSEPYFELRQRLGLAIKGQGS
ncbi:MAG: tetratricopeptide repeat protein [Pseudomonadota bacterium]